jgi:hypothetical protein
MSDHRAIGQNCGVILISDSIVATTGNRRKMPKQPDGHAVKRQLSIVTIRKNVKIDDLQSRNTDRK